MGDDRLNDRGTGRSNVSLDEDDDLRYWTTTLGVSRDALNSEINMVGNESHKVTQYLAKQKAYAHYY